MNEGVHTHRCDASQEKYTRIVPPEQQMYAAGEETDGPVTVQVVDYQAELRRSVLCVGSSWRCSWRSCLTGHAWAGWWQTEPRSVMEVSGSPGMSQDGPCRRSVGLRVDGSYAHWRTHDDKARGRWCLRRHQALQELGVRIDNIYDLLSGYRQHQVRSSSQEGTSSSGCSSRALPLWLVGVRLWSKWWID